jgi:recombination protein RecA
MSKQNIFKAVEALGKAMDKANEGSRTFQRQGNLVNQPVPSIPSNLISLDKEVLGCGGFPRGRIIEVYGPESAGKTAICLHLVGECQKVGGVAALVDAEHALSPTFADTLGVDMRELIISQPNCGEEALEIVEGLVDAGVDLIIVDSVAALTPRAEIEGEMGDSHMGLMARLLSQAMRKLCAKISKANTVVIFVNQVREKIGLVFGDPSVTTGGRALKFYSSIRLEVRRVAGSKGGVLKDGETIIGHRMNVKATKNKMSFPFKESIVDLHYATGFQQNEDLINYSLKIGILTGSAWLCIIGDGEKYRREDLPIDKLRAAVVKYHADIQSKLEESDEEDDEESSTDAKG